MFPGFPTRLVNEVTRLYKERILKGQGEMKMAIEVQVRVEILKKGPSKEKIQRFHRRKFPGQRHAEFAAILDHKSRLDGKRS
jgi:hypothetical protein